MRKRFAQMKRSAYFINLSRGPSPTSSAHRCAAQAHLAGAGIDVFEQEPVGRQSLLGMDNVLVTRMRCVGTTSVSMRSHARALGSIVDFANGRCEVRDPGLIERSDASLPIIDVAL